MRDTFLFDLDGTLVPLDLDDFLKKYFSLLTTEFAKLIDEELFVKYLMQATKEMINNNGIKTNQEVFIESFFRLTTLEDQTGIMKKFDDFYRNKFPILKGGINIDDKACRLIKGLKETGFNLILATNAVFPREAIVERLNWVNLDEDDFDYITCYEDMHYCKPNLDFFREILEKMKLNPDRCIMIGNDLQEDIIAGELGIETYLITDYLIDRKTADIEPDWQGNFVELLAHFEHKFF